jgi:NAD(P)-dependent dehydrogenase (short-subunit alcohol dehydrogenase family)
MASTARSLSGQVAVVTGAGRGIGAALARGLALQGAFVAVVDLDAAAARSVAAEIGQAAVPMALDVCDRAAFTALLDEVEQRLGPLDILVNNAGIMPLGSFEAETEATTVRQLELNLHSVIHGTREAVRRMRSRRRGHIVNISSSAGRTGLPGGATYSACKFGVVGLSEAVRAELRGTGVEVTVVMPGLVSTELAAGVPDARSVRRVTADEVAEATIQALRYPRFQVYVPKTIGPLVVLGAVLPWKVRDVVARLLRVDSLLMRADLGARAGYEARAAASAPAADDAARVADEVGEHPTVI